MLRTWRFITLLLSALGLIFGGAHVLEFPQKMAYGPELYALVTSTLYRLFGPAGAIIQVGAIVAACVLTFLARGRPPFFLTLTGTLCLVLSLVLWFVLVSPVNAEWLRVIQTAPESVAAVYGRLRLRWEQGHVAAFAAWLTGYVLLVLSVLSEVPTGRCNSRAS